MSLAALLLAAGVCAQLDTSTGHIKPTPGVPSFNPEAWNAAFKVAISNLPVKQIAGSQAYVDDHIASRGCSSEGFDTTPVSSIKVTDGFNLTGACFYKNTTSSTYDYWVKRQGLAFKDANCYCYALNRFEGDFCHPGTSQGGRSRKAYMERVTCPAMHMSLSDDGAVQVSRQQALTGQPEQGHYVAAMARPDNSCVPGHCSPNDYHFLRKDSSGTWSFKFPRMPATDKDLEGRTITDPEAAPLPGHYVVCGYYQVKPMELPLGSTDPSPGPLASMDYVTRLRKSPGVSVDITLAPYNPETDAIVDRAQQRLNAEDLEWERKRGSKEYDQWLAEEKKKVEFPNGKRALLARRTGKQAAAGR